MEPSTPLSPVAIDARIDIRVGPAAEALCDRGAVALGGRCPCGGVAIVVTPDGKKSPFAEFDHFFQNSVADGPPVVLAARLPRVR
jgi:hypothetical protein